MKKIKPIDIILGCTVASIGIGILCLALTMVAPNRTLAYTGLAFIGAAFAIAMIPLASLLVYLGLKKAASQWRQK